jgi:hypothetical protein
VEAGIDEIAGLEQGALVVFGGDGAVHAAQVQGAGADVDDEGVVEHVQAVGH